jgi:hypothetical protein
MHHHHESDLSVKLLGLDFWPEARGTLFLAIKFFAFVYLFEELVLNFD